MTSSLVNGCADGKRGQTPSNADSRSVLFQGTTRLGETRVGLADLDRVFNPAVTLPFHPNGLTFTATLDDGATVAETSLSVGGGFVLQEGETAGPAATKALRRQGLLS